MTSVKSIFNHFSDRHSPSGYEDYLPYSYGEDQFSRRSHMCSLVCGFGVSAAQPPGRPPSLDQDKQVSAAS